MSFQSGFLFLCTFFFWGLLHVLLFLSLGWAAYYFVLVCTILSVCLVVFVGLDCYLRSSFQGTTTTLCEEIKFFACVRGVRQEKELTTSRKEKKSEKGEKQRIYNLHVHATVLLLSYPLLSLSPFFLHTLNRYNLRRLCTRRPHQKRTISNKKIHKRRILVCHVRTKISPHNTVPTFV